MVDIALDAASQDASKVTVSNLPEGTQWQDLKDFLSQVGEVAFAGILGPGEVRFERAEDCQTAIAQFDGGSVEGAVMRVRMDPASQDSSKLIVEGLPANIKWQELKDMFSRIGSVAYAGRPCGSA